MPGTVLGLRWGWRHRWWRPKLCFEGSECAGEDKSRDREDSGYRPSDFCIWYSEGPGSEYLSSHLRFISFQGSLSWIIWDSYTLSQYGKQLEMQAKNTRSGVVHLSLAKSYHKTNGAVLELAFPLHLMLIIMFLLSGSWIIHGARYKIWWLVISSCGTWMSRCCICLWETQTRVRNSRVSGLEGAGGSREGKRGRRRERKVEQCCSSRRWRWAERTTQGEGGEGVIQCILVQFCEMQVGI